MAFPDSLLAAASTWWAGHISAAAIQTNIIDPLNSLVARVANIVPSASDLVQVTIVTSGVAVGVAVSFPAGRFSAAPRVVCTAQTSAPQQTTVGVTGITSTGCTIWATRTGSTAAVGIAYLAVQTPP